MILGGLSSRICGNITLNPSLEIINKYKIPRKGNPVDILNSKGYFQFRKDFLDGKCLKYCEACRVGSGWATELASREYIPEQWTIS